MRRRRISTLAALLVVTLTMLGLAACSNDDKSLTVYSGRTSDLIGPLLRQFEQSTGIDIKTRFGDSAEVAGAVLEEGDDPRADVLLVQDAGNLGQVDKAGRLATLPASVLDRVPEQYRSHTGSWVGLSGRVRVVAYNSEKVPAESLPATIDGFTDPKWRGRLAWAPTNASFQAFVTAFRALKGEAAAEQWLRGIKANEPKSFPANGVIVEAVGRGEVDVGFVNHYYLHRLRAEGRAGKAENKYFGDGDPGSLVNVAGIGIIKGTSRQQDAQRLLDFLLSETGQKYFAEKTFELPVVPTVRPDPSLPVITSLAKAEVDLAKLDDAKGTVDLLTRVGVL